MKSIVMPIPGDKGSIQLSEELKNELKTAANAEEKPDTVTGDQPGKQLTAADMWNLRRNSRSATAMLRKWNLN